MRRPGWVGRWALVAAAAAFVVPIVALALVAAMVGVAIFFVLALISALFQGLVRLVRGPRRDTEGRVNVRVVQRDCPPSGR